MNARILVINLDRAPQRWTSASAQLEAAELPFVRIAAVDGSRLPPAQLDKHYDAAANARRYHKPLTAGEKGCYLSHRQCWHYIVDHKLEWAIVLEDDFRLTGDLARVMTHLNLLPPGWKYVKLAAPFKPKPVLLRQTLGEMELVSYAKNPAGTVAQAVSQAGARLLLERSNHFCRPIDIDLQYTWEKGIEAIALQPYVVAADREHPTQIQQQRRRASVNRLRFWKLGLSFALCNGWQNLRRFGPVRCLTARRQ